MIKIDYKTIKKIFHCNGVYDGKTFYLIESFKYCNEVTLEGFNFLYDKHSNLRNNIYANTALLKSQYRTVKAYLDKCVGKSWNIRKITKYIDSDMKLLFNTILLTSDENFLTFDIIEDGDDFNIDIDSIH